ncbi:TPA: DUF3642 domain-containing protein [Streptococcus suis]|uniref:DUF3642 domain-containing protein n=3 Tax=Streptococcus suis TaxID=1307 RepID=A0A3R8P2L0_STRSU|nr:DUF3642 domain-containing protein [Streptococcus suis]MBY5024078.1 hypothetical protein [Streptococcus suis]MDG4515810.1 DUF3642 domain-containing protein [Streptococcus suis]MDG4519646.1 DUF3642 domain-containing protein [Streptococcus suis]MDG4522891.1 DUF3642 domain-containing protein [Streptococcus suis]NQL98469.1 hypothetical protein [Streptococcus suis]
MENNNQQQEIIEVAENKKTGVWESVKQKVTGMSKKSIILLSVGALALVTAGFVAAEVYENKLEALGDQIERQVGIADDDDDNQQVTAQANASSASSVNTTSASQLATSYGVKLVDTSELDGTYTATSGNDTYTLTVKGNQATLTEVDKDGEQDIEQVIFDLDKKLAYIDGEADSYTLNGPTLTLTEIDANDTILDKLTFTKQ